MLGIVVLVIVVVGAIGSVTYFRQRSFLYGKLDQQVDAVARGNASAFQNCIVFGSCRIGDSENYRAPTTEWIAILDIAQRQAVASHSNGNPSLKFMQLNQSQIDAVIADPSRVRSLTTVDGVALRVSARSVGANSGVLVVSGLSTDDLDRSLQNLVGVELVVGLGAVVLALLATAGGVRFTLRRLRGVTATAQEAAADLGPDGSGLERRVPDDEPETEVGQLARSFNTMLAAVQEQFAARVESEDRMRQFLADASHELRTPLTSIRGFAELARMQRAAGDTSDDNLDRIEFEGTRMSRLVEDLLVLARGDNPDGGRMRTELVELPALVDDAVHSSRAAFPDRPVDMYVEGELQVVGDRDQLLRVVRNLVTNAAVHTAPGRPIMVRAFPAGGSVVVQVADGGPGLPPEEAAHVFERFWRADKARTRARGGSGLGLSIVDTIVRAHGGNVRFDSTVESGSTVTVTLPSAESGHDD